VIAFKKTGPDIKAPNVLRGECGGGISFPIRRLWGSVVTPRAGFGAEPRPKLKMIFVLFSTEKPPVM